MPLTPGQLLALEQLKEISDLSKGALEVSEIIEPEEPNGFLKARISLAAKQYTTAKGFSFREREKLAIRIPPKFPFFAPTLHFEHTRFIGKPHVQWGNYVCLYLSSEAEWVPGDGLYGFFQRVDDWLTAAGEGELDPDDAPLHPPIAYTTSTTRFVFNQDTPEIHEKDLYWLGRADLTKKRDRRYDVENWVELDDWSTHEEPDHVAAAVLLSKPMPMEFPDTVDGLFKALEKNGVSFDLLYLLLKAFAAKVKRDNPTYIVIGAPMRRMAAGEPLKQHLTTWEIDASAVNALHDIMTGDDDKESGFANLAKWMVTAKTLWCRVFENRPEVTQRRDLGSLISTVSGKRVLLLGCGALGSAVAEYLVRAGVKSLHLVDKDLVSPGILVRQNYSDKDVGFHKSTCLAARLGAIGLSTSFETSTCNLSSGIIDNVGLQHIDLIINATASTQVAHAIESDLQRATLLVPIISLSVSAAAQCGSVVVKMPKYPFGSIAIDRLTKIKLAKDFSHHPVFKAFWPSEKSQEIFQPEPGCSAPTFRGSASDMAANAATLLNIGINRTNELQIGQASSGLVPCPWTSDASSGQLSVTLDHVEKHWEHQHGYEVVTSKFAKTSIAAELKRIARVRTDKVETGGLIFGEIDEAHRRIYVDTVTGPPPDSEASEVQFLCGTSGTREIGEVNFKQSKGSSRFVGIWHTHPISIGLPSTDDLNAMVRLLHLQDKPPRHIVMLIIGFAASSPRLNYYLFHRKDIRIVTDEELREMLGGTDDA